MHLGLRTTVSELTILLFGGRHVADYMHRVDTRPGAFGTAEWI
jgi:hypothetical protein